MLCSSQPSSHLAEVGSVQRRWAVQHHLMARWAVQHHLMPRRAVQHRCRGLSRMATPTPCGLPWVAPEQQRLRWAVQHHMEARRAVQHLCRGCSRIPTPMSGGLPWLAPEQQRLRYGDGEMHAPGSLDPAPATLKQRLARTLLINLCVPPMRPPALPNEVLNAMTTHISWNRNRDRQH